VKRREFITLVGGAAAAWPLPAHAQQAATPVIGSLHSATAQSYTPMMDAFRRGLGEVGYVEGKNVRIEYRWAQNENGRLPALAADLVQRPVSLIFAGGNTDTILAAKAATSTIPIVFATGADPVTAGLVASLNRPGGNLTGVSFLVTTLGQKKLELLNALVPSASVVGVLLNPTLVTADSQYKDLQIAARTLGLRIHVLHGSAEPDLDRVFQTLNEVGAGALVIGADAFLNSQRNRIVALAAQYSIPTIYPWREAVVAGGLMSYGTDLGEAYQRVGIYAGRVLNGEKPNDLPVEQAIKVELIFNLKTAKTLGLQVPLALLGRADEVIE
jgi:putative ABC transport system substrate-binding protein